MANNARAAVQPCKPCNVQGLQRRVAHYPKAKLFASLGGRWVDLVMIATQKRLSESMSTVTSSFRMSKELRRVFSNAAERTGTRKNAIIIEALVKYLNAMKCESLAAEARPQSELVSWNQPDRYGITDTTGWR